MKTAITARPGASPALLACLLAGAATIFAALPARASSHREAPFITEHPKVDGTDFYAFRSL
jgi:hypothetical protein